MSHDLESTLEELGPSYRAVVGRLRAGREIEPAVRRPLPRFLRVAGVLIAASLFVALAFAFFGQEAARARRPYAAAEIYTVAYAPTEEALEVIVASQRSDGSWSNDFLTQQNAAALRASSDARMRLAYRRAVRYLRSKGLSPLTDDELRERGAFAAKTLAGV